MGTLSYTPNPAWNEGYPVALSVDEVIAKASRPSAQNQEQLVLDHLSTVRFIARKIQRTLPAHIELEELVAAGTLGLVDAAARFRAESGVLFATFAQFRIRGAILDSLRDLDWAPRELRRKAREVEGAIASLVRRTGRSPEEGEIASELGLAVSDYQVLLGELDSLEVGSLNVERGEEGGEEEIAYVAGSADEDPLFQCLKSETRENLISAINELPERERIVITLYYYEELTMREIGQVLSVAESRVSQIRASAVLKLRAALTTAGNARRGASAKAA